MKKDYYFKKTSAYHRTLFYNRQHLKIVKLYKKSLESHLLTLKLRLLLTYTYKNSVKTLRETIILSQKQISEEINQVESEIKELIERIKIIKNNPYYYNSVG